jgi:hypothetical protein
VRGGIPTSGFRRPKSGESTGLEAVKSPPRAPAAAVRGIDRPWRCGIPASRFAGRISGNRPALALWNPRQPFRRPRFGESTGPGAAKSPPAGAAVEVRGIDRPWRGEIPAGRCGGRGSGESTGPGGRGPGNRPHRGEYGTVGPSRVHGCPIDRVQRGASDNRAAGAAAFVRSAGPGAAICTIDLITTTSLPL